MNECDYIVITEGSSIEVFDYLDKAEEYQSTTGGDLYRRETIYTRIQDSEVKTQDSRLKTPDSKLKAPDSGNLTQDSRFLI